MYQLRPRERAGGQIENTVGSRRAYLPVYMSRDDWGSSYLCPQLLPTVYQCSGKPHPGQPARQRKSRFYSFFRAALSCFVYLSYRISANRRRAHFPQTATCALGASARPTARRAKANSAGAAFHASKTSTTRRFMNRSPTRACSIDIPRASDPRP